MLAKQFRGRRPPAMLCSGNQAQLGIIPWCTTGVTIAPRWYNAQIGYPPYLKSPRLLQGILGPKTGLGNSQYIPEVSAPNPIPE